MSSLCYKVILDVAVKAAISAGELLLDGASRPFSVSYKGERNLVTEMDKKAETLIVDILHKEFPDHDIIAEEGGGQNNNSLWCWYIDPIDGTTNYVRRFPIYCVSIGLEHNGELVIGVVYQPVLKELFTAQLGCGAFLNGEKLKVSSVASMNEAVLATGFPYTVKQNPDLYLARFRGFMLDSLAIRRAGSAALDLCYVAAGRFDGFWESNLAPWDMAAGVLMVTEAGGEVTDFLGGKDFLTKGEIIASNKIIHNSMKEVLAKA